MSEATIALNNWRLCFEEITGRPWSKEAAVQKRAELLQLRMDLPIILEELAIDAEGMNIDSSDVWLVIGSMTQLWGTDQFYLAMDDVWAVHKRIETKEEILARRLSDQAGQTPDDKLKERSQESESSPNNTDLEYKNKLRTAYKLWNAGNASTSWPNCMEQAGIEDPKAKKHESFARRLAEADGKTLRPAPKSGRKRSQNEKNK